MTERRDPRSTPGEDLWAKTSWEGHARWQVARTLSATPLERLAWLEQAILLARAAGAVRRPEAEATFAPAPPAGPK